MDSLKVLAEKVHDTGCGCYYCVITFEPMAAMLHRRYTLDPEIVDPWPVAARSTAR